MDDMSGHQHNALDRRAGAIPIVTPKGEVSMLNLDQRARKVYADANERWRAECARAGG